MAQKRGLEALAGGLPDDLSELVGEKYHLVVSHLDSVPVVTNCFTGKTEQADRHCWSYDTVKRWSAPPQRV